MDELFRWVLMLPVDLLRALAMVRGPGWALRDGTVSLHADPRLVVDVAEYGGAWVPCDPTAVVEVAARQAGDSLSSYGLLYRGCEWEAWCYNTAPIAASTAHEAAVLVLAAAMGVPVPALHPRGERPPT